MKSLLKRKRQKGRRKIEGSWSRMSRRLCMLCIYIYTNCFNKQYRQYYIHWCFKHWFSWVFQAINDVNSRIRSANEKKQSMTSQSLTQNMKSKVLFVLSNSRSQFDTSTHAHDPLSFEVHICAHWEGGWCPYSAPCQLPHSASGSLEQGFAGLFLSGDWLGWLLDTIYKTWNLCHL